MSQINEYEVQKDETGELIIKSKGKIVNCDTCKKELNSSCYVCEDQYCGKIYCQECIIETKQSYNGINFETCRCFEKKCYGFIEHNFKRVDID